MTERLKPVEFTPDLARAYSETFIPRWDRYPIQHANGKYVQKDEPLTQEIIVAHLINHHQGKKSITLGAYALNQESIASWICLDADSDEQWLGLWKLAHELDKENVPSYAESSRRGGHLWLFTRPLSGTDARNFGKELLKQHDLDDMSVELYPKQDKLKNGAGSFVRLPLGVHRKTGSVYSFINLNGEPLAPTIRDQIAILSHPNRVPQGYIDQILEQIKSEPQDSPDKKPEKNRRRSDKTVSETLKNSISVYDFVSQYVQLDKHGKGLCPFHDDHHPSFQVNVEGNYWHCYTGCGGGSIIDFWSQMREKSGQNGSFTETVKDLRNLLLM